MKALFGVAVTLLCVALFAWAIGAVRVLRIQRDEVIARLGRMEHDRKDDSTRHA